MNERVLIPPTDQIEIINRPKASGPPDQYLPYKPGPDGVAPMASLGDGYWPHITGLTHDERGYPVMEPWAQEQMINRLVRKIRDNAQRITSYETMFMDDAEVVVVAYGISYRSAKRAVAVARELDVKAGLIKLNTVWPFPDDFFRDLAGQVKAMVMPEINQGQIARELTRTVAGGCTGKSVPHCGGTIIRPATIVSAMVEAIKERS
ncbi:MAG: 2-oxoacid:acceptor oxidoreductase subunit alpha, partial [Deltaproteobacteria bacterium]|nr:2-oxoacid:acceptor oxidoreductase subunit alpha [Deltaproteobacteria bacterium]